MGKIPTKCKDYLMRMQLVHRDHGLAELARKLLVINSIAVDSGSVDVSICHILIVCKNFGHN